MIESDPDSRPPAILLHKHRNVAFDALRAATAGGHADGVATADGTSTRANFNPVELSWRGLTFDVPVKIPKQPAASRKATADSTESTSTTASSAPADDTAEPEFIQMNLLPDDDGTRYLPGGNAGGGKGKQKTRIGRVLHGIDGAVQPGQMLAIMGASGSGKSTLLNLLAGRIKSSSKCKSGGSVLVNGAKRDFDSFKKIACYVEQDDTMFGELTVQEQLTYAALLRLPSSLSKERKLLRVQAVIQELGLSKCKDTVIGSELVKGISGGERKRVSIATELVTDPSLCLLDEPTTGLDAFNALNVMNTLRHLASNGRTIISTIHQPRSSIFALFDLLCVLSEGRQIYFGPAKDAATYFASRGFRAPRHFNIADYVIDAVSIDYRSKALETGTKKRVLYLAKEQEACHFDDLEHGRSGVLPAIEERNEVPHGKGKTAMLGKATYQNNPVSEFVILLRRFFLKWSRENITNTTRLAQTLIFAVLLGLIWLNRGRDDDAKSEAATVGVVFFLAVNQGFDGAFSVIFDFPIERAVLMRERASGSYRITSYFLAGLVVSLCKSVVVDFLFVTIVYWMVGLRSSFTTYLFAFLTTIVISQTGEAYSQAISVFTGDPQISAALVPLVIVLAFLFAGFFIRASAMPGFLRWGQKLSFLYWGYEALAKNEYTSRRDNAGLGILRRLNSHSRWVNLVILLAMAVVAKALFFLMLVIRRPKFDKSL